MADPPARPMALVLIDATPATANVTFAAQQLGVPPEAIDSVFGVVLVDPKEGLYSVLVQADALPSGFEYRRPFRGPFSNPRIEP